MTDIKNSKLTDSAAAGTEIEQKLQASDSAGQPYVELRHINKSFGDFKASDDVSFTVEKGSLVGLLGPSGSGKTTILRILAGLETADSGEIYINGKLVNNIPANKRGIGFVFQSYALFRYMTVFDNIAFGLRTKKAPKDEINEKVNSLIDLVGLTGLNKRYPNQLSGGQRQRVAFARALATEPSLLLLDEPFAAIDAKVRQELRSWLKDLIQRVGITSIFVTHDQSEAIEVADQIIITNHGHVERSGSPIEIYSNPESSFVTKFIGQPTIIDNPGIFNGFSKIRESRSTAVLRPEFISVTKLNEPFRYNITSETGIVEKSFFRGGDFELKVRVHDQLLTVNRPITQERIVPGEEVRIFIRSLYLLDGDKAVTVLNDSLTPAESTYVI